MNLNQQEQQAMKQEQCWNQEQHQPVKQQQCMNQQPKKPLLNFLSYCLNLGSKIMKNKGIKLTQMKYYSAVLSFWRGIRNKGSVLSKSAFDVQNLRGQGYDGASNMRGEFNGLQALFLRECPYAYYVHCYAHRLQPALVAASKEVVPVAQFFQKLLFIINTVDSSAKRHDELHDAQLDELARLLSIHDIETGQSANQIHALKRPGDTRWGSYMGSISSLKTMFNAVSLVLQKIASDGSAGSIRADGDTAFSYLSSFEFILVLCIMEEILEITEDLGQALQKKSRDIVNAMRLVFSTKVRLDEMRSDDGWEAFFFRVVEFCANHSIGIPDLEETYILRGGRARRQPDSFTKEHYFQVEIFRATLDTQLQELEFRFNDKVVKTRLRNKMEDEFLTNNLLVNIEREIAEKYDYEDILLHFTGAKRRRCDLE